jgi:ribonuclease HI
MKVYTDGSFLPQTGRGGYAAVVPDHPEWDIGVRFTLDNPTNQRCELKAVELALDTLQAKGIRTADVYTDSVYTIGCLTKWVDAWRKNGWMTSKKQPVLNRDIIEPILEKMKGMAVTFHHVKGHSGNVHNDKADRLARGVN